MAIPALARRAAPLLAALALAAGGFGLITPDAAAAVTAHRSHGSGWMRLAQLSPNTPAVDVYLYSFGDSRAQVVLHHVAYGMVSKYMRVGVGEYTVAIRPAGMPSKSAPVLSSTVRAARGTAYTVAAMGPAAHLKLQILRDRMTAPRGKTLIRIMQESMRQPQVTVTAGRQVLASGLDSGPRRRSWWSSRAPGSSGCKAGASRPARSSSLRPTRSTRS